jgi:hypothetical protein
VRWVRSSTSTPHKMIDSSQDEGMCGSRCCEVSIGCYRGWIGRMKVDRMQISRVHTDQRDCVRRIVVNGYDCISLSIVLIVVNWFEKVKLSLFGSKPVTVTAPILPGVVC